MAREMAAQVFGGGGSRKINIPGVGPIQMPSTAPGSLNEEQTREILNEVVSSRLEDPFGDPFEGLGDRMRESDDVIYELPENFKFPPSTSGNRGINPPLGKRADGSIIYLMDDDAMDILRSREITGASTSEETPTVPTPTGSYESSYIDWLESKPEPPTVRRAGRMPGGGPAYKRAQKKYKEDLANWEGSKPSRDTFTAPAPSPVDTQPVDTQPVETQPIQAPPPPDPFKDYVPRNILAPSFDPKDVSAQQKMVADARARMTPGANIQGGGYLTYDNPMLGNKQTQFGGYGQPMPTAPLMNYAGLSSPITYSTPAPNPDAQPGGPPPQIIR